VTAIGLLGDVMLGRGVARALESADPADVWHDELRDLCHRCDAVIANLECCISTRGEPTSRVPDKPFFFRSPPEGTDALQAAGITAAGLANNHALDFDVPAIEDTLDHLRAAGIASAGAGSDLSAARRGVVLDAGGFRVGLLAVSDHPAAYAAGRSEPGIAYADLAGEVPGWIFDGLDRLRGLSDRVIAFPHWGPNMTTEPSRWQRSAAAAFQDAGADLVAGHSAHVFHGVGWSDRGPLVYDLGDALDDYAVDPILRNDRGLMAIWRPDAEPVLELVGLELEFCHTRVATGEGADWIAARLDAACAPLGTRVERTETARFVVAEA